MEECVQEPPVRRLREARFPDEEPATSRLPPSDGLAAGLDRPWREIPGDPRQLAGAVLQKAHPLCLRHTEGHFGRRRATSRDATALMTSPIAPKAANSPAAP